jgi:hypothetical protein
VAPFPPSVVDALLGRAAKGPSTPGGVDGGTAPATAVDAGAASVPPR